jgi:hypothetical protein
MVGNDADASLCRSNPTRHGSACPPTSGSTDCRSRLRTVGRLHDCNLAGIKTGSIPWEMICHPAALGSGASCSMKGSASIGRSRKPACVRPRRQGGSFHVCHFMWNASTRFALIACAASAGPSTVMYARVGLELPGLRQERIHARSSSARCAARRGSLSRRSSPPPATPSHIRARTRLSAKRARSPDTPLRTSSVRTNKCRMTAKSR